MSRLLPSFALALFLIGSPALRADVITPDSIPSPPPTSPAAPGSSAASGGWVTDQYAGKGLNFPYRMTGVDTGLSTVIVQLAGVKVWAGGNSVDAGFLGGVSYTAGVNGQLVVPGTQNPATTNSLSLKLLATGGPGKDSAMIETFDAQGHLLHVHKTAITEGAAGTWVTLSDPGTSSFSVTAFPGLVPSPNGSDSFAWGVAAVQFVNAPEPTSLTLAGLGLLGLAGWRGRRWVST